MATKEGKQWWDPYETSNRRQFVHWPNSAAEILLWPASTSFIDSFSQSGPFGSTVYSKEFCWKPACKPECSRTGTASAQRRNNPHPSQSFMMWRLPRDATRRSEYVGFPWKCPPSEGEIGKALTAQYRSTYRCDFMGMPQGYAHNNNAERSVAPLQSRRKGPTSSVTEMRNYYCQPRQKPDLISTDPNVTCCGIVPTVVQRHVHTQQKISDLTSYDRFCGKRITDVTCVKKSLLPQELQQLHRILPEEENPNSREEVNKLPAIVLHSCSPEWISSWPGPL